MTQLNTSVPAPLNEAVSKDHGTKTLHVTAALAVFTALPAEIQNEFVGWVASLKAQGKLDQLNPEWAKPRLRAAAAELLKLPDPGGASPGVVPGGRPPSKRAAS